ncbi:MAG: DUF934 domain-containing protein [Pseudomonadota bacterium]
MALIKNGEAIADSWTTLDDEADAAPLGDVFVSLDRWRAERETLAQRPGRVGVRLKAGEAPSEIASDLEAISAIALEFPTFKDGRAYSYARLLRERFGYQGEVRAVGDVLRDQFAFMARCGFDAFETQGDDVGPEEWRAAMAEFSVAYQPAADARRPALALRRAQSNAA